jgi:hypothetical protein
MKEPRFYYYSQIALKLNLLGIIISTHRNIVFLAKNKAFHLFKAHIASYAKEMYFLLYSF